MLLEEVQWAEQWNPQKMAESVYRTRKGSALILTLAVECCFSVISLWLMQVFMNVKPGTQGE